MSIRHAYVSSDLGELLMVADGDALTGIYFENHWYPPAASAIGDRTDEYADPLFTQAAHEIREFLSGTRREFTLDTRTDGDAFSERVWSELRKIPYGQTTTYGQIAGQLGDRNLAQRVGQAVGHNPLSIVIACHRVVGADGALTGYAGGLPRKRRLLELEEEVATGHAAHLFAI
ncbi:methylated-DNA--[protein]-cysteine S-methyltransferase [Epidermidibacterium keratini]|uniref:Methylated-DNA--protein-cysteine methyltransferase n=1 Tax=Epidermidibacterium keratini TaxID=1891644 RepID=A0A7L4YKX3_9ACTN|nr:methylated-DNA--[protein]-cysteine S-methyltransferase [Epidermidibacterium keratini]QHB99900.1 methylated-DNA--[protein]-cysteine S-methyltransferase [Epidermidibacterium keratini]